MKINPFSRCFCRTAAFAALASLAAYGHAQSSAGAPGSYPDKSIRLLVGNAPGGGSDITARTVAEKLAELLGRSVIVDNRAGASGIIAMNLGAQATPNGYTLLVVAGADLAGAMTQNKLTYDVRTAYAPISQLTSQYYLLLMTPSLPVNSVKDLIDYAKSKPRALSFGSAGVGSAGHAGLEFFKSMTGTDIVHVPYKGIGPALIDMISGQLQLAFVSTISSTPHLKSGKLRALAVTSAKRARAYLELPTIAESGAPGFDLTNWYGLYAPAGTPRTIVQFLHRETVRALNSPDLQARFANAGAETAPSATPAEFGELLEKEVAKWQKIMKMPGFADSLK